MPLRLDDGQIEVVDDEICEILRRKTPAERVAMVADANRFVRLVLAAQLGSSHPEWDERTVLAEVARRMGGGAD